MMKREAYLEKQIAGRVEEAKRKLQAKDRRGAMMAMKLKVTVPAVQRAVQRATVIRHGQNVHLRKPSSSLTECGECFALQKTAEKQLEDLGNARFAIEQQVGQSCPKVQGYVCVCVWVGGSLLRPWPWPVCSGCSLGAHRFRWCSK